MLFWWKVNASKRPSFGEQNPLSARVRLYISERGTSEEMLAGTEQTRSVCEGRETHGVHLTLVTRGSEANECEYGGSTD